MNRAGSPACMGFAQKARFSYCTKYAVSVRTGNSGGSVESLYRNRDFPGPSPLAWLETHAIAARMDQVSPLTLLWGTNMRKIQYGVAVSVDGYIAGPNGEADWIQIDPEIDFSAIWSQFDTLLMGRRTYEAATRRLGQAAFAGKATFVFSKRLEPKDHLGVTIISG